MKAFYHSADLDGHCSGTLIKMAYPGCKMIGINYGDGFPWENIKKDEKVFMVDFSLQPFDKLVKLHSLLGGNLVWIDHHKSAIEEEQKYYFETDKIPGLRHNGIGACRLVWDYLKQEGHFYIEDFQNISHDTPTFIKLLAEYDVWNHTDPRTLSFQYGMRQIKDTSPDNQEFWCSLFNIEEVHKITENGGIILDYQMSENKKYTDACAFETELDGVRCIAINKMLTNSQMFDSVWDEEKYDAMLTFGFRKGQWTVSLYSTKEDIDVSEIAKNRGGGGHKGAAGFQCRELPFLEIVAENNKPIPSP